MTTHALKPAPGDSSIGSPPSIPSQKQKKSRNNDGNIGSFGVVDLLRVLGGVLLLSGGMSWLWTSGESLTWGYNAWWTRAREWKALMKGQVLLTDEQLLAYDGSDPNKPIYVALNGTIYDVSASRQTYGPGGSYHFFAGRDAARAFLTGCFQEDLTADLRGVEEMYIPKDPSPSSGPSPSTKSYDPVHGSAKTDIPSSKPAAEASAAKPLTKAQLKIRREQELRIARKKVREGLEGWHILFRGDKGKPYFKVGEVVREKGWLEKLPKRKLCDHAESGRPVRKAEGEE